VKVTVEVLGRAFAFQFTQGKVPAAGEPEEKFEHAPVDPHSVSGGQVEHGPGADSFVSDVAARMFGFGRGEDR
jgi:hypothetical protein